MQSYDPKLSLGEARDQYFALNGFDNGGYDEKWVKMRAGPIPIAFPNTKARLRAVKFHDLHHVLTEYETTWCGEAEIGAWEVATGCADHYPAWLLNLCAFAIGLVINPRRVYAAFLRGRHSTNLYRRDFSDRLLGLNVGAVRQELQLNLQTPEASPFDRGAFLFWSSLSMLTIVGTWVIVLTPIILVVVCAMLVVIKAL